MLDPRLRDVIVRLAFGTPIQPGAVPGRGAADQAVVEVMPALLASVGARDDTRVD